MHDSNSKYGFHMLFLLHTLRVAILRINTLEQVFTHSADTHIQTRMTFTFLAILCHPSLQIIPTLVINLLLHLINYCARITSSNEKVSGTRTDARRNQFIRLANIDDCRCFKEMCPKNDVLICMHLYQHVVFVNHFF